MIARLIVLALGVAAICGAYASSALAYLQPTGITGDQTAFCGIRPLDYIGIDAQAAVLVDIDQRAWDRCARGEMLAAQADADAGSIKAAVNGTPSVNVANFPAPSTSAQQVTATYSDSTATQVDNEARTLHGDLWILVGAVVGCFVATEVLRRVFP